jgi:PEP-CTERM motif
VLTGPARWIRISVACGCAVALLGVAVRASADTIGVFSYDQDLNGSGLGPGFTIFNESADTFTSMVLQVFDSSGAAQDVVDLNNNSIPEISFDPLDPSIGSVDTSLFTMPLGFDSALLTLSLVDPSGNFLGPVTASIDSIGFSIDANGNPTGQTHLDSFIGFTPSTSPVPEPSTLLLLGAGALIAAVRRKKA